MEASKSRSLGCVMGNDRDIDNFLGTPGSLVEDLIWGTWKP